MTNDILTVTCIFFSTVPTVEMQFLYVLQEFLNVFSSMSMNCVILPEMQEKHKVKKSVI